MNKPFTVLPNIGLNLQRNVPELACKETQTELRKLGCSYIYQDEQPNDCDYSNTYVSHAEYSYLYKYAAWTYYT